MLINSRTQTLELTSVLPESIATDWTYTRMARPHPSLTMFWLLLSTGIFYLFELPAAVAFLARVRASGWVTTPMARLTAVTIAGNALLFDLESGMNAHIRYGLPTFVILQEAVTVLALLWFFGSNPAKRPNADVLSVGTVEPHNDGADADHADAAGSGSHAGGNPADRIG